MTTVSYPSPTVDPEVETWMEAVRHRFNGTYGIIYTSGGSTPQTGVTTTYTKLLEWTGNGLFNNTRPDYVNDQILLEHREDGVYLVFVQVAFSGAAASTYEFDIYIDGVATPYDTKRLTSSTDTGSCSIVGIVNIKGGDAVEVFVKSDSGPGVSLTVAEAQLAIYRIA